MHWATAYIGQQWSIAQDCYALVRQVYADRYRIDLPVIAVNALSTLAVAKSIAGFDLSDWVEVTTPQDGDVVQMGHAKRPHHLGIWLDIADGKILHSTEHSGVIAQSVAQAKINGWRVLNIYRHKLRCRPP